MPRCKSPFCITENGLKGREFTPADNAVGIDAEWCPECLRTGTEIKFFTTQTAAMIRNKWREYDATALPKEVKLFMDAFVAELIRELGEEL